MADDDDPTRWSHSTGEAERAQNKKARSITSSQYSGDSGSGATAHAMAVGQSLATVLSSGQEARRRRKGGRRRKKDEEGSLEDEGGSLEDEGEGLEGDVEALRSRVKNARTDDNGRICWYLDNGTKVKVNYADWLESDGEFTWWDKRSNTTYHLSQSEWDAMPSANKKSGKKHRH